LRISVSKFKNDTGYERDNYFSNHTKNDETKQPLNKTIAEKVEAKDLVQKTAENLEMKSEPSPQRSQSPIQINSDVTMDEVILGSTKKEEIAKPAVQPKPPVQPSTESNETPSQELDQTNDSNEE